MTARWAEEWAVFLLALQFLTRLPVPAAGSYTPARMAASPRWYPGVGVLVGAAAGLVFWLAALVLPPVLAGLISTAAGLVLTGALHEDGFADVCDSLGASDRARALAIMRDSRIGTYGAAGLGLMLAGKVAALAALPLATVPLVLVAGHAASRASATLALATGAYARDAGAAAPVSGGLRPVGLAFALGVGVLPVVALALALPPGVVGGGALGLVLGHAGMRLGYERRLGGYTGDCLGAVQQTSELGLYLGVLACL